MQIGGNFTQKNVVWEGEPLRINLWDLAGQDHFASMSQNYYKNSQGCIVVFDSSQSMSLDGAIKWKQDLDAKWTLPNGKRVPAVLFVNKVDLNQNGWLTEEKLKSVCKQHEFLGWFVLRKRIIEIKSFMEHI